MDLQKIASKIIGAKFTEEELSSIEDINWTKPNFEEEYPELERTAEEMHLPLDLLEKSFKSANLEKLTTADWDRMINADSNQPLTLDDVYALAKEYGRDLDRIFTGILKGDAMPAAIVLMLPDGTPYGVGGNTRLMAARVLGIQPEVLMMKPDYELNVEEWKMKAKSMIDWLTS